MTLWIVIDRRIMITRDPMRKETDIRSAVQKFIYTYSG